MKTQVENGLINIFDFQGQTINSSEQPVFTLKYLGLHDEQGKKINTIKPLTESQRRSDRFLFCDDSTPRPG